MDKPDRITDLENFVETRVDAMGFEVVDIRPSNSFGREMLEIYCDRKDGTGIKIDDCSDISSRLKYAIEAEGFFTGDFSLIVSSPGLDRVIKKQADFEKFNGREIRVVKPKEAGGGNFKGRLIGYKDGELRIEFEGAELILKPEEYKTVRLVPEFDKTESKGKLGKKTE